MSWYDPRTYDWRRIGAAAATGGLSEAATYGYNEFYGKPATQQQQAYGQAGQQTRQLGQDLARQYDQRGQQAINRFDRAGGVFDRYYGGGAPSYQRAGGGSGSSTGGGYSSAAPRYTSTLPPVSSAPPGITSAVPRSQYAGSIQQFSRTSGGPGASAAGGGGLSGYTMPGSGFGAPLGGGGGGGGGRMPGGNQSSQLYDEARGRYGQSYTGDFVRGYQAPTMAQDYARQRQMQGYGPNQTADRYSERQFSSGPHYLEGELGSLRGFATGGTGAYRRELDRRDFAAMPTSTSGELANLRSMDPSQRTDSLRSSVMSMTPDANSGAFANELARGGSAAGQFRQQLASDQSDTGRFLRGFDSSSAELRNTYNKLSGEGPSYEEDFYTSQMTGENPAYKMLQEDALKAARNSSAARGGFNSGQAMENERRTIARLAAEEFGRRGDLAATAGAARRERLGQELSAAETLHSGRLGSQSLLADTGLRRESTMAGLVGGEDSLRAGLAQSRDSLGLDRARLAGDLSTFGDSQGTSLAEMRLRGAGQQDDLLRRDQDAIDNLAISDDATRTARMGDYANQLGNADTNRMQFDRDIDTLADRASTQGFQREQQMDDVFQRGVDERQRGLDRDLTGRTAADTDRRAQDANMRGLAGDASQEFRDNFRTEFDAAMAMGNAQAGMQMAYDMAAMGALSQAELSAIDTQLAAAGIPLATRQAFANNLMQVGGMAIRAS